MQTIDQLQQQIYDYLLNIVRNWTPADVLAEFKHLFIHHANAMKPEVQSCLYEIIFFNHEQEFRYTLKRSCYILINNWDVRRNRELIQQLIELFADPVLDRPTISPTLKRLRQWLRDFVGSLDFQELKLYTERHDAQRQQWTSRFASYLLVSQFANPQNSIDQRQAARRLSRHLREQFKFDLAHYTALSQCSSHPCRSLKNPTTLALAETEDVAEEEIASQRILQLIKRIVQRRSFFGYSNVARIFLSQTQHLSFQAFKQSLLTYLTFGSNSPEFVQMLQTDLGEKLLPLYAERDGQPVTDALLLRSANRLVDYLLSENGKEPSLLFIRMLSRGNAMRLVIVLLKIVLLCRYARVHLETRIADIIRYYEQCPEQDCRWVINFLEMLHITLTIYTENVQYTLVNMDYTQPVYPPSPANLETYRIFSQICSTRLRPTGFAQITAPSTKPAYASQFPEGRIAPSPPAEVLAGNKISYAVPPIEQTSTPA
ncbi:hypothetical protein [Leptolyngbya ohadii]|uniref:hypothetical protein n=1 Tax=Leptolyngbya ohadii TaxID=1962290 RepID=UPI00117B7DEE|nr:hypothetical protein [Leptolyngbya ohadii]